MSDSQTHIATFDSFENALAHYGMPRRSGRYPWGSGENPFQNAQGFLSHVNELRKQGLTDKQIVEGLGLKNTADLRALRSIARDESRQALVTQAVRLKEKNYSNVAIAKRMNINESSVRSLLDATRREKNQILDSTMTILREHIDKHGIVDVGTGVEHYLGISDTKKKVAIAAMEREGYKRSWVTVEQAGTGKETTVLVLTKDDLDFYKDIVPMKEKIAPPAVFSDDGGASYVPVEPPKSLDSSRIAVRYKEEGGADKDGVIELRRGVDDLSLGAARYAQVRVAVDGDKYLKGMAMYSDNMPEGVDVIFNTNKSNTGNKLDAMKKLQRDSDNPEFIDNALPFGSMVRQKYYIDANGERQLSPLNIVGSHASVNQEGRWGEWSRTLSSQMLSKQSPQLAQRQLDLTYQTKRQELEEILSLTNPSVKRKLLEEFSDGLDSAAGKLKAAALPRTRQQVLLPINSLKDNEVYAPNFKDGETVVLIRHPHGGIFEIPQLKVNNRNKEARRIIPQAADAVGINSNVAAQLSGADFDGDTVLVIPNNAGQIRTAPPLRQLKGFEPSMYKIPEGSSIKPLAGLQQKMGDISNLITDMTIKGATDAELARAVRHSMVVIDAPKHNLDYRQSALDHGIKELKEKYQRSTDGSSGAATIISRARSVERVGERSLRRASEGGPIDPVTGEKVYTYTGKQYTRQVVDKKTGAVSEVTKPVTLNSTKMAEARDANTLVSDNGGMPIERVYANHANRLKSMANEARKASLDTGTLPVNKSAKETYRPEIESLGAKLRVAQRNAPLERRAQILTEVQVKAVVDANPNIESSELKKRKASALEESRRRTGASKDRVTFTPREWEAVQAGAISKSRLEDLLTHADMDQVRELATPRAKTAMTTAKVARARAMVASGYTQSEIAEALGVSTSTITDALK